MTSQWRRLALSKQGLASQQPFGAGVSGTRRAIEHLGYVQIDTLSVIERAHHHVLWNRVPGYDLDHLNQLVSEQHIVDYWYHAASYLPMRDYRYALPHMASVRNGETHHQNVDKRLMNEILSRVGAEGPLQVRDLEMSNEGKGKWWKRATLPDRTPSIRVVEKLGCSQSGVLPEPGVIRFVLVR